VRASSGSRRCRVRSLRVFWRATGPIQDLDTVYVVLNHDLTKEAQPDERLLPRSDAVIFVLKRLGGIWKVLGLFVQLLPPFLLHWGYRVVGRHRYRVFGRFETCMLPSARDGSKFFDS